MRRVAIGLLAVLLAAPVSAASFDCIKAAHPLEKAICGDAALSKLDEEVGSAYRTLLADVYDKRAVRVRQQEWQAVLRRSCAASCDTAAVRSAYAVQLRALRSPIAEGFADDYKTTRPGALTVSNRTAMGFTFSVERRHVDESEDLLCRAPATGDAVARLSSPTRASWLAGSCRIDFTLIRDAGGGVTRIDLKPAAACSRLCKGGNTLEGQYRADN
jgi:uncharacterized protein